MTLLRNSQYWLWTSAATIIASILIIAIIRPVWGIDFAGGSLIEIEAEAEAIPGIEATLQEEFDLPSSIQTTADGSLIIRTSTIDESKHREIIAALREQELFVGEERRFETIGPTIGQELRRKSATAITFVIVVMVMYLAHTFRGIRGMVRPWKFGIAAAYALIHDLLLVTALFVIFGKIWDTPIDTLFVTAQLAIIGYSVNDTIVLFNRLKEEWLSGKSKNVLDVTNKAISATLSRSLNTSLTTLLVLTALLVFGGSTIRWFVVALTAGTITGTYSSLFVAPPLLHYFAKREGK